MCAEPADCESLVDVGNLSYRVSNVTDYAVPISALLLDNDTVVSGSGAGIYAGTTDRQPWRLVIGCGARGSDYYPDCYMKEEFRSLFSPEHLWWHADSKRIVVYDNYCDLIMTLEGLGTEKAFTKIWRDSWDDSYLAYASLCGNVLLGNKWIDDEDVIALQLTDDPGNYKKLAYRAPALPKEWIASQSYRPVLNPKDSTIWVDLLWSGHLFVLDFNGRLIDSVPILAGDWIPPGKPKSRIKSRAVWREWESRWTPTTDLQYAEPGYFILQYRVGWHKLPNDSVPLFSTLVWNTDREPVELQIDHRWQLAGVQPDGRIIFGHYDVFDDSVKVILDITRINP